MILAGDIGGTKVHLALYNFAGGRLVAVRDHKFPANEYPSLDQVVKAFLVDGDREDVAAACFGCPGPVRDGRLKLTNLPWTLDTRDLTKSLGMEHIFLINDLEANGYGIPELAAESIVTLQEGDPQAVGHRGLVSAGTGLGECLLVWDGKLGRHMPLPSEGGHGDFAARNPREIALLEYLLRTLKGRVSIERVVSGLGIQNVYRFLRDDQKLEEPKWLRERMESGGPECGHRAVCRGRVERDLCGDDADLRLCLWSGGGQCSPEGAGRGRDLPGRWGGSEEPEDHAER